MYKVCAEDGQKVVIFGTIKVTAEIKAAFPASRRLIFGLAKICGMN